MRKTNALLSAAALAAFAIPIARPAFGGIAVIDQVRSVHISGQAADIVAGTGPAFDQSSAAGDFASFDQSLSNTSELGGAVGASASASQSSTLTLNGSDLHLSASGSTSYGATGLHDRADGTSSVYLVFTLDTPATYTLTEQTNLQGLDQNVDGPLGVRDYGVALTAGQQTQALPGWPFPSSSLVPSLFEKQFAGITDPQVFTGTLAPGTYTLNAGSEDFSAIPGSASSTYSLDFTLTAGNSGNGNGNGGIPAVPLPPAAWMGLGTIGLIVGGIARRRRAVR
jgi:hypothetical protein